MERSVLGLNSPNVVGILTPKREFQNEEHGLTQTRVFHSPAFLQTPKREQHHGEMLSGQVKNFHSSAFTQTSENETITNLQAMTPITTMFSDAYTPSPDQERVYWSHGEHTPSPDTPGRRTAPERTLLIERLPRPSTFILTPERQPLDFMSPDRNKHQQESGKRGRPRADMVTNLIMEGSQSGNAIKCHICSRVFPREKSLQAHLRTHTGERPYNCDYPGCSRAFTQSGQLKTHQRLHAGEKPFVCSTEGCNNRYTHANRTCPEHPYAKPKRTTELILQPIISASEDQEQVFAWLQKYRKEREEKTPGKGFVESLENEPNTPERSAEDLSQRFTLKSKRGLANEMEEAFGQENVPSPPRHTASRNEILRSKLTAQQTFSQALMRAGERLENNSFKVLNLGNQVREANTESTPGFRSILEGHIEHVSPAKSMRKSVEECSPMRGIRRTLGEITPSKNCKADNAANLDLELPFNFDLPPTLPTMPVERLQLFPTTPRPSEKYFSPISPCVNSSPGIQGSPALKLKKRFQERFQEEKLQEKNTEDLAKPISWHDEDVVLANSRDNHFQDLLATPARRERNNSPTFLVATALVELHESPTRLPTPNQDLPLNLTKKSYN